MREVPRVENHNSFIQPYNITTTTIILLFTQSWVNNIQVMCRTLTHFCWASFRDFRWEDAVVFQPCRPYCYFNTKVPTCQQAGRSTYISEALKVKWIAAAEENVHRAQKSAAAHPRGSVLFRCILPLIIQAEPIKTTIITVISPLFILMPFPICEVIMSIFARRIFLCWQRR